MMHFTLLRTIDRPEPRGKQRDAAYQVGGVCDGRVAVGQADHAEPVLESAQGARSCCRWPVRRALPHQGEEGPQVGD